MSLFEETKRKVSLGAGLQDGAAARAGSSVLESCDPERRVMVAFGLGVTTYLFLRNSIFGSQVRDQVFRITVSFLPLRRLLLGLFGQLNLLFLGHKL